MWRRCRRLSQGWPRDAAVAAGAGVDKLVCVGDSVQRQRVGGGDLDGTVARRRGQVVGGMFLGVGREVVAAEEADGDVVEQHRPEREVGPVGAGGVGGDDGLVPRHGGVEVDVVGERHLDDAVHPYGAWRRKSATGSGPSRATTCATAWLSTWSRSRLLRTEPMTVAPPQCASWAAIDPTPPSTPWTRTIWLVTGPSPNTARWAVMPGMPRHAPSASSTESGQFDGAGGGHNGVLGSSAEG